MLKGNIKIIYNGDIDKKLENRVVCYWANIKNIEYILLE